MERTDGGLEVQDGAGRACWKMLGTKKGSCALTHRCVGFKLSKKNGAWVDFWLWCFEKSCRYLFALLIMWSVSENIIEKKSPKNIAEKMLTVMRIFWPRYGWPKSFRRWKRWPKWNTVTGRIPIINYTGKPKRIKFSPLALIPCWKRERENLNSHSYN